MKVIVKFIGKLLLLIIYMLLGAFEAIIKSLWNWDITIMNDAWQDANEIYYDQHAQGSDGYINKPAEGKNLWHWLIDTKGRYQLIEITPDDGPFMS